jgi:hypothetical protein
MSSVSPVAPQPAAQVERETPRRVIRSLLRRAAPGSAAASAASSAPAARAATRLTPADRGSRPRGSLRYALNPKPPHALKTHPTPRQRKSNHAPLQLVAATARAAQRSNSRHCWRKPGHTPLPTRCRPTRPHSLRQPSLCPRLPLASPLGEGPANNSSANTPPNRTPTQAPAAPSPNGRPAAFRRRAQAWLAFGCWGWCWAASGGQTGRWPGPLAPSGSANSTAGLVEWRRKPSCARPEPRQRARAQPDSKPSPAPKSPPDRKLRIHAQPAPPPGRCNRPQESTALDLTSRPRHRMSYALMP